MVTIKEIAELAGVSRGTVDRALNNRGAINAETAKKINEIATALGYIPNRAGIALAAQKKKYCLGVILFGRSNPFFDEVVKGVQKKANELAGYNCSVIVKQVAFDVDAQLNAIDELLAEGIQGIALSPYNDERIREKIDELYHKQIPVITLNTDIADSRRIAYVGSNYFLSGEVAAGLLHLVSNENAHIGIITGFSNVLCHTNRIAGFKKRIKEAYPTMQIDAIIENQDDDFISYEQTKNLLENHPDIQALYFAAGGVLGGCRALLSLGRTDIKVLCYDLVESTKDLLQQGVIAATICQQPELQGSLPLALLFSYLSAGKFPEEYYYVSTEIHILENI